MDQQFWAWVILGSLASKPVMEGKSVLFKRFADIDSIDIEIDSNKVEKLLKQY